MRWPAAGILFAAAVGFVVAPTLGDTCDVAALGERLFVDASFSGNNLSCASCHVPDNYFQDSLPRPAGKSGIALPRNTPSLLTLPAYTNYSWDGRNEVLTEQVREVLTAPAEVAAVDERLGVSIASLCPQRAFESATESAVEALTAYIQMLPGPAGNKSKSTTVEDGAQVFDALGCARCHVPPHYTDNLYHDIGLERLPVIAQSSGIIGGKQSMTFGIDYGRGNIVSGPSSIYQFRTPSLLWVAATSPYMHDGRFESLDKAILEHGVPGVHDLAPNKFMALISFLSSL